MKYSFSILFMLVTTVAWAAADSLQYKNLVFEGGGVRGIAYAGALKVLDQRGILRSVERVGGTSVGAITALLLAVGYSTDEMTAIMSDLRFEQFNDGRWFFVGGLHRMIRRFGWYRGEQFERWLEDLIGRKTGNPNLTFAQLHQRRGEAYKDLYVTGTNLTAQRTVVFSHLHTPDMALKTAVRISMSVPLYFGAVFLDDQQRVVRRPKKGQAYQILVDGGLTANYPLTLFDEDGQPNVETLGLKLERPEQLSYYQNRSGLAPYSIRSFNDYVSAFYNYVIENLNRQPASANEKSRTIYISMEGIRPRVRRMRADETERLYQSGQRAAQLFQPISVK